MESKLVKKRVLKFLSGLVMTAQIFQCFLKCSSGLVVKFLCCLVMTAKFGQSSLKFPSGLLVTAQIDQRVLKFLFCLVTVLSNFLDH